MKSLTTQAAKKILREKRVDQFIAENSVSRAWIYRVAAGDFDPSCTNAAKLFKAVGVDAEKLISDQMDRAA